SKLHPPYNNLYGCITLVYEVAKYANTCINLSNALIYSHMYAMLVSIATWASDMDRFIYITPYFYLSSHRSLTNALSSHLFEINR
ncbi:unnamed protein product, partial [Urochloa humidicola]